MKMMNVLQTACILIISFVIVSSAIDQDRKVFIAYMGFLPEGEYSPSLHHYEILKNITSPRFASKALIRSYQRSFNGFAAYLSQEEQQKLAGLDGIISVFPCQKLHLQKTRSWDYMDFPSTVKRSPVGESNTIIGVIDGGIWPEPESFSDEGLGPIPAKWKGECQGGKNFTCNRKIIGARTYGIDFEDSARDVDGHGTHVASIIAGNQVVNANYYGLAEGIARGGVPAARLLFIKPVASPATLKTSWQHLRTQLLMELTSFPSPLLKTYRPRLPLTPSRLARSTRCRAVFSRSMLPGMQALICPLSRETCHGSSLLLQVIQTGGS